MALFAREFITVPEDRKNQLVFKWPDVSIRRYSRAIVNADEIALFVDTGHVMQTMGPGRHRIDTAELPGLGAVIDTLTGGAAYRAELYFVGTKEFPGLKFGGRLDDIVDPRSEQVVTLRAFGEYAVTVRDPAVFITSLIGTVDLADPGRVTAWCADQLVKSLKVAVSRGVTSGQWPVLGLSAYLPDIETVALTVVNQTLYEYGLRITRMGNFDISLAPDDADRLKRLAKDIRYSRLAGGFQQYAAGEMALGAGHGMASGSGGESGFLAAGLGMNALGGQLAAAAPQPHSTPASAAPAEPVAPSCTACFAENPVGARFCTACGKPLAAPAAAEQPRFCGGCGSALTAGARFCSACGAPAEP